MILHVTHIQALDFPRLELTFSNGRRGVACLSEVIKQGIFQHLQAPDAFAKARLDEELRTVTWKLSSEMILDLAPEYLYFLAFKDDEGEQGCFKLWGYVA